MDNLATTDNVEAHYRTLTSAETTLAESLLTLASGMVINRIPTVATLMVADEAYAAVVKGVIARAVVRVLRAKDPRDPAQGGDLFITNIDWSLIEEEIDGPPAKVPVGSFPPLLCYPVY